MDFGSLSRRFCCASVSRYTNKRYTHYLDSLFGLLVETSCVWEGVEPVNLGSVTSQKRIFFYPFAANMVLVDSSKHVYDPSQSSIRKRRRLVMLGEVKYLLQNCGVLVRRKAV